MRVGVDRKVGELTEAYQVRGSGPPTLRPSALAARPLAEGPIGVVRANLKGVPPVEIKACTLFSDWEDDW